MQITEIRIKLMEGSEDRLRAFCSITIDDCFVIRDLKIIDGTSGPFVAMPSRKLAAHCHRCGHKNHLRASYCNHCGVKVSSEPGGNIDSPQKLYADVAHPINSECREMIQQAVITEFESELSIAQEPGYRSRYDDEFDNANRPEANRRESGRPEPVRPEPVRPEPDQPETGQPETDQVEASPGDDAPAGRSSGEGDETSAGDPIRERAEESSRSEAEGSRRMPKSGPPRPHFIDGPPGRPERQTQDERGRERQPEDREGQSRSGDRDDDFGAGIF